MLSIGPYISASIIVQLLVYSFPSLKKMQEGDGGRQKTKKYTKYLTIVAAMVQGYATSLYAKSIPGAVTIPFIGIFYCYFNSYYRNIYPFVVWGAD